MIFVAMGAFAQDSVAVKHFPLLFTVTHKPTPATSWLLPAKSTVARPTPFLSPSFYASQLGFFCKQEIKFDKTTKIPFRFRLGSLQECDWLEGKGRRK